MDEELRKKIEQARQEGYTDDEINAFLAEKGMTISGQQVPAQTPGPVIPTSPTTGGPSTEELQLAGVPIAATAGQAALTGMGLYGGYKLIPKIGQVAGALKNRMFPSPGDQIAKPVQPVQPIPSSGQATKIPVQIPQSQTSTLLDRFGKPMLRQTPMPQNVKPVPGPVAPQPNVTQSVQRMAFDKLKQFGPRAGAAMFALTPGELGPKVPQSGPFRGMEINPQTGRPFTEQELAMYR